ncbi:LuxR C-terminal-related transcriptional regulator [Aldersonia sp. NBC_00410]|uniref:helix-turn-helix transcriptional regulator n=1 Tax=Aldersonia sp. NBC_00410 TaxID=2975954 RepID=UPI00225409A5|nr:LuxR family transcriptional regulator [Aldersonia sp. NBC_00410]MCX5045190.1 LuxR C-terminal-related transcriptional regulator [Aldersonia sp. NBC_00410]
MSAWPLVERQTEFDEIRAVLTGRGDAGGVLLTGAAGVGKTTLARAVTKTLPGHVRWVAGTESARSIPLGVFAHVVGPTTSRDPVTFMSAARKALLAESGVVIGVDDAHLLDRLSATLLHQIAIDRAAPIVATVRSGETVPDAVTSLWKDGHLRHIDLTPFTKQQSVELVEAMLSGPLEGLSAELIWEASAGNALYLRHLVDGALEAGSLREANGVWQLRGRATVTAELATLLADRLDRLPDAVLNTLRLLTLCEPIDADVLAEVAGEQAVEDAENQRLVRLVPVDGRLDARLQHPLFGEVLRRSLGVAAARRLRGRLVATLAARPVDSVADRIRLAELGLDSDRRPDVALLDAAANDAMALADVALSERFARAAVDAGGGATSAAMLARVLLWQGEAVEAESTLTAHPPIESDQIQLVRWGLTRIANSLWSLGDSVRADQQLAAMRKQITIPALSLIVEGAASACALHENRLDEAVAAAERVLSARGAPPVAIEWACFGGGRALALMGRSSEVMRVVDRMDAVAGELDGLLRYPAALCEVQALAFTGDLERALARAEAYREFSSAGQFIAWALANTMIGTANVAMGRFGDAVPRLEQAIAAFPEKSAATWSLPAKILLIEGYAALGRSADAARLCTDAKSRMGRHVALFGPQLDVAEAWLAAAEGAVGRSVELARAAAESATASGQLAVAAEAWHTASRFGDRTAAAPLAELAERIDGRLVAVQTRHAAAVAAGDGKGLDAVAAEFEAMGALLSAADAAAQAATAHGGDFRVDEHRSAAHANRLAVLCGGARTPALLAAANPLPLTVREREIANLVATGLTNRLIAERLVVSVRTVEGHLYRICAKLGVADRSELAKLIRGEGR